jgi:hypothetical protein
MSAGSGASNLGYGNTFPFSNVNYKFANVYSMNDSSNFGSKVIPGTPPGPLPGLAGTKDNVAAANGEYPGPNIFSGGAKKLKRKIKNITKKYKMKGGSRKRTSIKNRIKSRYASRSASRALALAGGKRRKTRRTRRQRGGYSQYQNNLPMTPTYSVGGILPSSELGLANPPPIKVLPNCTNCVDNYNHFTGKGFPSRGH